MRVKQVYEAYDGQEFSSEDDCLSYEKSRSISALWNLTEDSNTASFILNNYEKIKVIMEPEVKTISTEEVKTEVDWDKVAVGTKIYVRDNENVDWCSRSFIRKKSSDYLPFICFSIDIGSTVGWQYAKLITD